MRVFWQQVVAGMIDAMGGETSEPFGIWPAPPLPKPDGWAKRKEPITLTDGKANS